MHSNPAFRATDADLLDVAARLGLAHIFCATPDGPMVAHAPISRHGATLRFHVARGNRIARHLDGATVLVSIVGVHGYISPNWYAGPRDQVPTWNYHAIEIEGRAAAVPTEALIEQLDALADVHEPRVIPDNPWTSAKMDRTVFARMLTAIRGFELAPTAVRGTTKLGQNKSESDRVGAIEGLRRAGDTGLADAMATHA